MATQAPTSAPRHARPSRRPRLPLSPHDLALPVTLGIVYGIWAPFNQRRGGPLNADQIVLGVVSGVVLAVLVFLLARMPAAITRELRGMAIGAVAGVSVGFLYSLTYASVLRSCGIGLVIGAAVTLAAYYLLHTREN